jgi:ABC-type Na+ efflux pump permease subunit
MSTVTTEWELSNVSKKKHTVVAFIERRLSLLIFFVIFYIHGQMYLNLYEREKKREIRIPKEAQHGKIENVAGSD